MPITPTLSALVRCETNVRIRNSAPCQVSQALISALPRLMGKLLAISTLPSRKAFMLAYSPTGKSVHPTPPSRCSWLPGRRSNLGSWEFLEVNTANRGRGRLLETSTMPASPPMPLKCYLDTSNFHLALTLEMAVLLSRGLRRRVSLPVFICSCDPGPKYILLVHHFMSLSG